MGSGKGASETIKQGFEFFFKLKVEIWKTMHFRKKITLLIFLFKRTFGSKIQKTFLEATFVQKIRNYKDKGKGLPNNYISHISHAASFQIESRLLN